MIYNQEIPSVRQKNITMKILNPFLILLINIHTFSCNPVKIPTNTTTDPLPSCYKIDIAYNLGRSIATKTTNGPLACQTWCQVKNILKS